MKKCISYLVIVSLIIINGHLSSMASNSSDEWIKRMHKAVSRCKDTIACEFKTTDGIKITGYEEQQDSATFTVLDPFTNQKTVLTYAKLIFVKEIKVINADDFKTKIPKLIKKQREIRIRLIDGTKLKGYIVQSDDKALTLKDSKTSEINVIAFAKIIKVETEPRGQKIIKRVLIGTAVVFIAWFVFLAIAFHGET